MGNCFGTCLPNSDSNLLCKPNSSLDFDLLIEEVQKPVLQLVDGMLNPQISSYCRLNESQLPSTSSYNGKDIPLQCLDASALICRTTASTPIGSIDLEWEHETLLPSSMVTSGSSWTALAEDLQTDSSTHNAECSESFSRISSANSLEWDNVQQAFVPSPPVSEVDSDTQVLLKEIERLTKQTLSETGKELFS